jgi:hypothetical protein
MTHSDNVGIGRVPGGNTAPLGAVTNGSEASLGSGVPRA